MMQLPRIKRLATPTLEVAYEETGPVDGVPVILLHGFPDDVRAWDGVVALLAQAGCRIIVPYLRGCGHTRFLNSLTPRSGQQAALGQDLLSFMDALGLSRAALAGYDWGGRAACIVAALWPARVRCLISICGYNIHDLSTNAQPDAPEMELRYWYHWYFQTERGRQGLERNRRELCHLLWTLWSPNFEFDEETFNRTAISFENLDYVDVVIHSYRHRYGHAIGDPALDDLESRLALRPAIATPTLVLHGAEDGVAPASGSEHHHRYFTGPYDRIVIPVVGHFLAREAPQPVVSGMLQLLAATEAS
jgi:pimeloyl-ACP methyl ester carboxylesterase